MVFQKWLKIAKIINQNSNIFLDLVTLQELKITPLLKTNK